MAVILYCIYESNQFCINKIKVSLKKTCRSEDCEYEPLYYQRSNLVYFVYTDAQ